MLDCKLKHEKEVLGQDAMFGLLDTSLSVGKCLAAVTHKITVFESTTSSRTQKYTLV